MKSEILVIDDNADIRFLICNILKDKDYIVRSAANYNQAVFEINKKLPDLAIIDIKLDKSDKDGIELLKLVMKIGSGVPGQLWRLRWSSHAGKNQWCGISRSM